MKKSLVKKKKIKKVSKTTKPKSMKKSKVAKKIVKKKKGEGGFFGALFGGNKSVKKDAKKAVKKKSEKVIKTKKSEKVIKTKKSEKVIKTKKSEKVIKTKKLEKPVELKIKKEKKVMKVEVQKKAEKIIPVKLKLLPKKVKKLSWRERFSKKRDKKQLAKLPQKTLEKIPEPSIKKLDPVKINIKSKGPVVKEIHKAIAVPDNLKKGTIKLNYLKTGIEGFDALLTEGIPEGTSILVEGGPGSGKTVFCLELIKTMCAQGKKVLYMSFEEPEYRLRSHLESFGTDAMALEKKKQLYIKRFNALDIARSVEALLSEAKKELLIDVQPVLIPHDFEPDIVLVDSLTSIGSAFSGEESRFRIYMEQLFRYLESHQITSFLIRETSSPTHIGTNFVEKAEAVSFLSDGIIAMYNVFLPDGGRKRAIEIIKMRGVHIKRKVVECQIISGKGIVVYPNRVMTGSYKLT